MLPLAARFENLWRVMADKSYTRDADLVNALSALPSPGTLPLPRETWLVFSCMLAYLARPVGFDLYYWARGCSAEEEAKKRVSVAVRRMRALSPTAETVISVIRPLIPHLFRYAEMEKSGQDWVWAPTDNRTATFVLTDAIKGRCEVVKRWCGLFESASPTHRVYLAAMIGDWELALEMAHANLGCDVVPVLQRGAAAARAYQFDWIHRAYSMESSWSDRVGEGLLRLMRDFQLPGVRDHIAHALTSDIWSAALAAHKLIQNDPGFGDEIVQDLRSLTRKLKPIAREEWLSLQNDTHRSSDYRERYRLKLCCSYLTRHGQFLQESIPALDLLIAPDLDISLMRLEHIGTEDRRIAFLRYMRESLQGMYRPCDTEDVAVLILSVRPAWAIDELVGAARCFQGNACAASYLIAALRAANSQETIAVADELAGRFQGERDLSSGSSAWTRTRIREERKRLTPARRAIIKRLPIEVSIC